MTEEDTFNKLRRVSYPEACVIYTMSCFKFPSNYPRELLRVAAEPELLAAGWPWDVFIDYENKWP